jgi:hypothetical protein
LPCSPCALASLPVQERMQPPGCIALDSRRLHTDAVLQTAVTCCSIHSNRTPAVSGARAPGCHPECTCVPIAASPDPAAPYLPGDLLRNRTPCRQLLWEARTRQCDRVRKSKPHVCKGGLPSGLAAPFCAAFARGQPPGGLDFLSKFSGCGFAAGFSAVVSHHGF